MTEILVVSAICSIILGIVVLAALQEKAGKRGISSLSVFQSLTAALLFFVVVFTVGIYQLNKNEKEKVHVHVNSPEWISDGDYENIGIGNFSSSDPANFHIDDSNAK